MKKNLLGIVLLLVSVLFVGNVYAEQKNVDFFFGEVKDVTSTKGDTIDGNVKVTVTHNDTRSEYTFTYDEASLKYVPIDELQNRDMEAAWVGIHVDDAKYNAVVNGKFASTNDSNVATVNTYTIDGKADSETWDGYVWFHVTKEEMEKAVKETNGIYTRKLVITWKNGLEGDEAKIGTQTITVNIKAAGVTLQAKDEETTLWDQKTYEDTVKKVEAEKLAAEENANKQDDIEEKGTEEDGELDDAPETNDTFPMALVGMISLGLAGTYVVKKLHN